MAKSNAKKTRTPRIFSRAEKLLPNISVHASINAKPRETALNSYAALRCARFFYIAFLPVSVMRQTFQARCDGQAKQAATVKPARLQSIGSNGQSSKSELTLDSRVS